MVLVTGAARRVGAEIARLLHAGGARVILHCRSSVTQADCLADALNAQRPDSAAVATADLSSPAATALLAREALARFGRVDGLVNNASSFFATPVGSMDEGAWQDLLGSNLKGPLFLSQALAPALRESGGAIVNITDIHAERPLAGYGLYCAAKAGLLAATRSLAIELAPRVRVNAVAPGAIVWPEDDTDFPAEARAAVIEHTLLKRMGQPGDIARTVQFLLFDAPYITGQVINVDGGRTAHL